jgi:hypothetical protein
LTTFTLFNKNLHFLSFFIEVFGVILQKNSKFETMEKNQIEIYQSDNAVQLNVLLENETVWLTQAQMSQLFDRDRTVISKHINNVFKEKELDKEVTCAKFAHVTQHGAIKGKTRTLDVEYYNLDVIISVGYRVKSQKGTQFRQWATNVLKSYLIDGYAINNKVLSERNSELITQLQTLSVLMLNKIPVTEKTILEIISDNRNSQGRRMRRPYNAGFFYFVRVLV